MNRQCQKIQDERINKCLKRIILDEELHIEILESLCKKYPHLKKTAGASSDSFRRTLAVRF